MAIELVDSFFFFNDTAPTEIYTLSLHDALPICRRQRAAPFRRRSERSEWRRNRIARSTLRPDRSSLPECPRSEEHTSELQSQSNLVCRLLLEKKNTESNPIHNRKQKHTTPIWSH